MMRSKTKLMVALALAVGLGAFAAQSGPAKLKFENKRGVVVYDHAKHVERAKGDCKVCHAKLFPQSAKAPLNYKAGLHKLAESKKIACAACHIPGGKAFESAGNCVKCHAKPKTT